MDLGLKGKSVLILASSKGLGKATAQQFAAEGARIMLSSRNADQLALAAQEIKEATGAEVNYQVCDITNAEDIKLLVEKTVQSYGTIDVLINNAGGPPPGSFDLLQDENWIQGFELNLLSFVRAIREVLPYMRKQGSGHILNVASSSIKQPIDGLILSNTFRAGILGLSKSLSQELASDNILINTIGPGKISTDRVAELENIAANKQGRSQEEIREASEKAIPLGRYGQPEEFANIVVFLCSSANTYITGQAFLVDGGMVKSL